VLRRLAAWSCVAALSAGAAWCQASAPRGHHRLNADVYAGYFRFWPPPGVFINSDPLTGYGFGGDFYLANWLAVAGEAQWTQITYDAEDNARSDTFFAGPRFFLPLRRRAFIIPFADVLAGAANFNMKGIAPHFNGNIDAAIAAAFAVDGGVDVRVFGPFSARVEAGFVHSTFWVKYPDDQPYLRNQHGRLLIEGVWHF
jgi:hypothetical protein